jgi:hypothetical protein
MIQKLEEIKKIGAYAMSIFYGEDIGYDDMGVSVDERHIQVSYSPVGFLGEIRILWKGKMKDFLAFDFRSVPTKVNNPPIEIQSISAGFFAWGTDNSIEDYMKKFNKDKI